MVMIKEFQFLRELLKRAKNNEPLGIDRVNFFGSRKSGKTKSLIIWMLKLALMKKTVIYGFRYYNGDVKELFKEFKGTLQEMGLMDFCKENLTYNTITLPNGSLIELRGLHKTKNDEVKVTGLAGRIGFKYAVAFAEERYEISDKEWSAVTQAIRGFDEVIEVHAANPWLWDNDYVRYCNKALPFELEKLKEDGQQFKVVEDDIYFYTNYQINEFLNEKDVKRLKRDAAFIPAQTDVILYGYPGAAEGGIFTHVMSKILAEPTVPSYDYYGGVDYGEAMGGDATAAYVVGFDGEYSHAHIEHEYYHANTPNKAFKDTSVLAGDVLDHFIEFYTDKGLNGAMLIMVDSAAIPFITALNNAAFNSGWGDALKFVQSTKYRIKERTDVMVVLAALGMFTIDKDCRNAIREFQGLIYSKKSSEYRTGSDHGVDAIEYGVAVKWMQLLQMAEIKKEVE